MRISMPVMAVLVLSLCAASSHADTVFLRNGGRVEGKVTRKDGKLHVEQPDGVVIVDEADVDFIEPHKTPIELYEDKLGEIAQMADGQGEAFAKLGQWCAENRLKTQALSAYKKAVQIDPDNLQARTALGYALFEGKWMTVEDANLARGLVKHKDAWVTPEAKVDLEKLEAATKFEQAKAETERLRMARAEAELQAANAKADAAMAEVEALKEQYRDRDYYGYGGVAIIGSGHSKPAPEKPIVLGPGDRATITDFNPLNGVKYTKPDGTTAKILTVYRIGAPPVTRPIYSNTPPQIIDPNKK
ncbi:MAG: hypothetical protein HY291_14095 [Planctomycetes bacterium]|nr:hypothetical protein [Planctomycetota bacterium]